MKMNKYFENYVQGDELFEMNFTEADDIVKEKMIEFRKEFY